MTNEQLEDKARKQLKANAERARKRLQLPSLDLPVSDANVERVEWFVNQLRSALTGERLANERYNKALHFPPNTNQSGIEAVAQNLSIAQDEQCAYELHAQRAATWLSTCGATIGQSTPLLDEFIASGLIQNRQVIDDATRVLAAARKNNLKPAKQSTGVSEPVLDEIDMKLLKSLGNYKHAVKLFDLAMSAGCDRDICASRIPHLIGGGLAQWKYAKTKSNRPPIGITQKGKDFLSNKTPH